MTVLYSRPNCQPCIATKRALDRHGIPHTVVDVTVDLDAAEHVRALGHLTAPVVVTPDGAHWSGYRPDRIAALAAERRTT